MDRTARVYRKVDKSRANSFEDIFRDRFSGTLRVIGKWISTLKRIIRIYKDLVEVFDDQNETRLLLNVSVEGQGSLATPSVCLTVASALLLRLLPTLV